MHHPDCLAFPAQACVLDEGALFERIVPLFNLPASATSCRFDVRGDSDVYRVRAADATYYLKIRRPSVARTRCEAEARLVAHLSAGGARVVRPVARRDSGYAVEILASEGPRAALLFEAAPPNVVSSFDTVQAEEFGRMLALLHHVADEIPVDPDLPEADPMAAHAWPAQIAAAVELSRDDQAMLEATATRLGEAFRALPRPRSAFGPIHGDLARSNLRRDETGNTVLFDFGAAERSWRSVELANVWRQALPRDRRTELWPQFLAGYASVGQVPAGLENFLPINALSAKLAMMAYVCGPLTLRRGIEPIQECRIVQQVNEVRQMLGELKD